MIELSPHGFFFGPGQARPILILKPKEGVNVLPVWITLSEIENGSGLKGASFHQVTGQVLKELGYTLVRCDFVELKGMHQYVNLHFEGTKKGKRESKVITCAADEAMSFCHALGAKFYASQEFIEKCRNLNADLIQSEGDTSPSHLELSITGQKYLI